MSRCLEVFSGTDSVVLEAGAATGAIALWMAWKTEEASDCRLKGASRIKEANR